MPKFSFLNVFSVGLGLLAACERLAAVAALVVERRPQCAGLSSWCSQSLECATSTWTPRAQLLLRMWTLPGSGIDPASPALAGRFLTSLPPGKSHSLFFTGNADVIHKTCRVWSQMTEELPQTFCSHWCCWVFSIVNYSTTFYHFNIISFFFIYLNF